MKHYNDIVIVGIDHGYGNIKTANTVTPTGIMKLDTEPTFTDSVLFYEDSYYRIGEGHKEFISDKWQNNDFYLFTLMSIAKELKREGLTSEVRRILSDSLYIKIVLISPGLSAIRLST